MNTMNLSPAQKAGRTNHERAERRRAAMQDSIAERNLIIETMRGVLNDTEATAAEKVRAAEVLTKLRESVY